MKPVEKSSNTMTFRARCSMYSSTRWEPMNPAPPVIRMFFPLVFIDVFPSALRPCRTLKRITSEYFISFEQYLPLDVAWRKKVHAKLSGPRVAVTSGMRFADNSVGLRKTQQYVVKKHKGETRPLIMVEN